MKKLSGEKQINKMILLCVVVYFVSYITRINLGAVVLEIVTQQGISRTAISPAITGSFITYGAGQLLSGYFGDKFSPKNIITLGLSVTSLMNFILPLCPNVTMMIIVWCINGLAQSFIWPPLVKIMCGIFPSAHYQKASVRVSYASALGTVAVYLFAPLCIYLSGWKSLFFICSLCGAVTAVVWSVQCSKMFAHARQNGIDETITKSEAQANSRMNMTQIIRLIPFVLTSIIAMGILRDGLTTWTPSYISETFNLSSFVAILTGVLLPLFAIVCFNITARLNKKLFTNELTCAGVIFTVGFISVMLLYLVGEFNAALTVILCALAVGCTHGVNLMLIVALPKYFEKFGKVSLASGILNTCTYIGSALSTYGIAAVSESSGWGTTMLILSFTAALGAALCMGAKNQWLRFKNS